MTRPMTFDREAFLRTTMKLFWEYGYEATSVDTLLGASNIKKGSFYHFFASKKDVLAQAMTFYFNETMDEVNQIAKETDDAPGALRNIFSFFLNRPAAQSCPNGCFIINIICEFGISDPDIQIMVNSMTAQFEDTLSEIVSRGQKRNTITNSMRADDIVGLLKTSLCGILVLGRKGDDISKIQRTAYHIHKCILP